MVEYYANKELSAKECARLKNCAYTAIYKRLQKYNIPIRNGSECQKGKLSWNWQGGISKEPYPFDFTDELKELIRKRDNYKCQICGCPQAENIHKLSIHHKDYNKDNLNPENLLSLCKSCHTKTNFKREYWIEYFQGVRK